MSVFPVSLLKALRCPICAEGLGPGDTHSLRCARRHTFDVARQGYVNLLGQVKGDNADDAEMVRARAEFLDAGHYRPLATHLADLTADLTAELGADDGIVLDAGAGTGYYLAAVLDQLPSATGLAMDISKFGLRRAARAHPRAGAMLWDVWQPLPISDDSFSLILNVFAPRNGPEFRRVLRPDGALVVVTPTNRHLAEIVVPLRLLSVDNRKAERVDRTLSESFRLQRGTECTIDLTLCADDVMRVARMGPTAHHVAIDDLRQRVAALNPPLRVTASFVVSIYRPR